MHPYIVVTTLAVVMGRGGSLPLFLTWVNFSIALSPIKEPNTTAVSYFVQPSDPGYSRLRAGKRALQMLYAMAVDSGHAGQAMVELLYIEVV